MVVGAPPKSGAPELDGVNGGVTLSKPLLSDSGIFTKHDQSVCCGRTAGSENPFPIVHMVPLQRAQPRKLVTPCIRLHVGAIRSFFKKRKRSDKLSKSSGSVSLLRTSTARLDAFQGIIGAELSKHEYNALRKYRSH